MKTVFEECSDTHHDTISIRYVSSVMCINALHNNVCGTSHGPEQTNVAWNSLLQYLITQIIQLIFLKDQDLLCSH